MAYISSLQIHIHSFKLVRWRVVNKTLCMCVYINGIWKNYTVCVYSCGSKQTLKMETYTDNLMFLVRKIMPVSTNSLSLTCCQGYQSTTFDNLQFVDEMLSKCNLKYKCHVLFYLLSSEVNLIPLGNSAFVWPVLWEKSCHVMLLDK